MRDRLLQIPEYRPGRFRRIPGLSNVASGAPLRIDYVADLARALQVHPLWLAFGEQTDWPAWFLDVSPIGFGYRLGAARIARGLTQKDLAASVTQQRIGQFEGGRDLPNLDLAIELAQLLRVRPAWLAYWAGEAVR